MQAENTGFEGLILLKPRIFSDKRGFFFESYSEQSFSDLGITDKFVQDNQSYSSHGVLRGLHFQRPPFAQSKLVRVLQGAILDVVVDLRADSRTFGRHYSVELSYENQLQLFVPKGFAHGFVVLSESADLFYKCDAFYNKQSEGGIIYNDPALGIDWKLDPEELIVSEKDLLLPKFKGVEVFFNR